MADQYTLNLHFTADDVKKFVGTGFKVCFAKVVNPGDPGNAQYNVVAVSRDIAANITITWTEEFAIAASNKSFQNGVTISSNTDIEPIQFQNYLVLSQGWSGVTITPDKGVGQGTFGFKNNSGTNASAIVYKKVDGQMTPIFVQAQPTPSGMTEQFAPTSEVAVWLENDMESSTMISNVKSKVTMLNYYNRLSVAATWKDAQFVESPS